MSWDIFRKAIEQLLKDGKFIKLGKKIIIQMIKKHDNGKVTVYVGSALSKDEQDKIKEDPSQMLNSISQNYEDLFDLADQYDFDINNANIIQGFADHKPGSITTENRIHYYLLYFKLYKYFKECDSSISAYEKLIYACGSCGYKIITEEELEELAQTTKRNNIIPSQNGTDTPKKTDKLPEEVDGDEEKILQQDGFPKVINKSSSIHLECNEEFKRLLVDVLMGCPTDHKISCDSKLILRIMTNDPFGGRNINSFRDPKKEISHYLQNNSTIHTINDLLKTVPIYLVNEEDFDKIMPPEEEVYLVDEERSIIDTKICYYCGCYTPNKKIYLCPERIKNDYSKNPLWGYVSVCVHEFGHAYMDVAKYNADPSLLKYVEEPIANLFLLNCATKYSNAFFDFVTTSIRYQPIQYKLANKLFPNQLLFQFSTEFFNYNSINNCDFEYFVYHLWALLKGSVYNSTMRKMKHIVLNYDWQRTFTKTLFEEIKFNFK